MTRDFIVGLLFLTALVALAGTTLMVGDLTTTGFECTVVFDEISGLAEGDEVRLRGARVGEVKEVRPPGDDGVEVVIQLHERLKLKEGSFFKVMPTSLLGGVFVDYIPGTGNAANKPYRFQGQGRRDVLEVVGEVVEELRGPLKSAIAGIEQAMANINAGKGLLGRLISDEAMANDGREILSRFASAAQKIDEGEGALGTLINDEELGAALRRIPMILENVERISSQVEGGEGVLGMLINDPALRARVERIFVNIDEQKGILGRLIGDEAMAEDLRSAISHLDDLLVNVGAGEGILPRLLSDPEWAAELDGTLANLREITEKINQGQGTFGRLVNEDTLYRDISATLILTKNVVEDAREQAPINAFISAVFQAAF